MNLFFAALLAAFTEWQFYAYWAGALLVWWLLSMAIAHATFKAADPRASAGSAMLVAMIVVVLLTGGLGYFVFWPADLIRVGALSVLVLILAGGLSLALPARK